MPVRGLRVTGGRLVGRRLRVPGRGVRPTADRVRESLFTRLGDLSGMDVLDLYAGSGVLGVEAFSRGAAAVVFVERSSRVVRLLRENLTQLGLEGDARVVAADAPAAVRRLGGQGARFDLVLLDPPYAGEEIARALTALAETELVSKSGTVVVEHSTRHPVPLVSGWVELDVRSYGDTRVTQLSPEDRGGRARP